MVSANIQRIDSKILILKYLNKRKMEVILFYLKLQTQ